MTWFFGEVVKEGANTLVELEPLGFGQTNESLGNIPEKADIGCLEFEVGVSFVFMPWNAKGSNPAKHLGTVIVILKFTINDCTKRGWDPEDVEVVLILCDWANPFCLPDVDECVCDHAGIATSACSAERVVMIDIKVSWGALKNEPDFVGRNDRAGTMKLLDIESARLGTRWCCRNLGKRWIRKKK
jgi:hypothetical protein